MGALQGAPQSTVRPDAAIHAAIRDHRVPTHRIGGGILQPLPGTSSAGGSTGGKPACTAVHKRFAASAEPSGACPRARNLGHGHESGQDVGADRIGSDQPTASSGGSAGDPVNPASTHNTASRHRATAAVAPSAGLPNIAATAGPSGAPTPRGGWAIQAALDEGTRGATSPWPVLQL